MKKIILAALGTALLLFLPAGCSKAATRPVEVVSFRGPMPPINPGGPNIEIVVKNVSRTAIVALKAEPDIKGPLTRHYVLNFDVSQGSPLQPGQSISSALTLINGGIQDGANYQVTLSGTFLGGRQFVYSVEAKISVP